MSGNPGGRPKLLSDSYQALLGEEVLDEFLLEDMKEERITFAEMMAWSVCLKALKGDVSAAREIRAASEGEKIHSWRDDIIDLLRNYPTQ